jgi:TRAP-type C4-dicarboxylate transport system permease small subunit
MSQLLRRLDDAVARVEKGVVIALLAVMSLTVFLDVLHRISSTPEGLLLKLLCAASGRERTDPTLRLAVPLLLAFVFYWLFWGALRTASGSRFDTAAKCAAGAAGLLAASVAFIGLVLTVFPNGIVWSQPLALSLLLWVALLGATLATKAKGHIVLEVADKLWPARLLVFARLASALLSAVFCLATAFLGWHFAADFREQWQLGVGYVPGLPLPKFFVFLAIPVTFTLMAARFLGHAAGLLTGDGSAGPAGHPGLAQESPAAAPGEVQS